MTSGALCSDHVNYLIFRYLQEAGHENAATAFHRDWHRLPEFKDPENYPFAPVVRRGELVHVIQDGLRYDELIAKTRNNERRFHFTSTAREGLERGAVVENGLAESRPASSRGVRPKGIYPPALGPPDEFPTPAPKRQRRSEGSEGVHLNGDAMDVDAASGSPKSDADEEDEQVSPGEGEEVEIVEVPERYDSMDAAVQTAVKAGPVTTTMYWKVDKPGAIVYHSAFSPAVRSASDRTNTLMLVGESLCRFYQVPDDVDDSTKIQSLDDPSLPPNSVVTASAWSPDGTTAACAIDSFRELPDGKQESRQTLLTHSHKNGTASRYIFPPLLDPGAIILALRYRTMLLVVRTNGKRGLVLVYDTTSEKRDPLAWKIFEHPILDAVWTRDPTFAVCGSHGQVEHYRVKTDSALPSNGFTAETITTHGLEKEDKFPTIPGKWDKVRYDERAMVLVVASTEDRKMSTMSLDIFADEDYQWTSVDLPGQLTALAFRVGRPQLEGGALLAATFEDGACALYAHPIRHENAKESTAHLLLTMHMSTGPAYALAWTPDGAHLAVAGTDVINIWEIGALTYYNHDINQVEAEPKAPLKSLVTWRADAGATGPKNGEHAPEQPTEPSLSWSGDGESLAFAIDRQIAIIRFQTPLKDSGKEEDGSQVNGMQS